MKRLFTLCAVVVAVVVSSCSKFDDTDIWDKLNDHESRITALEELCKQMNTNITALQTIVEALEKNDYITNVSPVRKDGEVIGYNISFAKSDSITIYHGENGRDGADGKDGYTPQIGVMKDTDGIYYWTLDGEWLLDGKGNKIQANGIDGGDGIDGITPRLKIENDYWYVSYDNGVTWTEVGKAIDNPTNSSCPIIQVQETENEVIFTLADGSQITISKKEDFSNANNVILYTTANNTKITPNAWPSDTFGAVLISNRYVDGQGVMVFDDDVTKIGDNAFEGHYFSTLVIPSTVTDIHVNFAPWMLKSDTIIYCKPTKAPWLGTAFTKVAAIYVPMESVDNYKNAQGWSNLADCIIGYDFDE